MNSIKLKNLSPLLFTFFLTLSPTVFAEGGGKVGGGNFSGLDAAAALKLVPLRLKQLGADLVSEDQMKLIDSIATSSSTVVAVSSAPIPVEVAGIIQNSSAYTVGGQNSAVIFVFQGDWDAHKSDANDEIAFMTHEVCVALGIEKTGQYGAVSSIMLNRLRSNPNLSDKVVKKIFHFPLIDTPSLDAPGTRSQPAWTHVAGYRPIVFSPENARGFCAQVGYKDYDPNSTTHGRYGVVGMPGDKVAWNQGDFDKIPNNMLYKAEIIYSVGCTE